MGVHLCESADLSQVDILSVAQRHNLIEGKDQVETVLRDFTLLENTTVFRDLGWRRRQTFRNFIYPSLDKTVPRYKNRIQTGSLIDHRNISHPVSVFKLLQDEATFMVDTHRRLTCDFNIVIKHDWKS